MLAVADDGTVYVTRRSVGDVVMLRDTNGDGVLDQQAVVASRPDMHGIAVSGGLLVITAGVFFLPTPGPGFVIIALGAGLTALGSRRAARALDWTEFHLRAVTCERSALPSATGGAPRRPSARSRC